MADLPTAASTPAMLQRAALDLRALLDAAVDAVIVIDHRGRIETFNRSAERLFGYTAQDVIGENVAILMPDGDRSRHDGYMRNYLATGHAHIIGIGREVIAQRRDGSTFPASLSVGRIEGEDPPRFVGFIHDITVRRAAIDGLRRERDRAQSYLDLAEVMLLAVDATGRVALINRKGCEILGYAEAELLGRNWFDLCIPEGQRAGARKYMARVLAENADKPWHAEDKVLARGGVVKLLAWRATIVRDEHGKPVGVLTSGEDVTERRRAERALIKSESLLNAAQAIAQLGNYEVALPHGESTWSAQMYRMTGVDPASGPLPPDQLIDELVHADDRDRIRREWQRLADTGGTFDQEFRLVTRDGTTRDMHTRATIQHDARRGTSLITGTLHDITERKLAEEATRQGNERLTHVARLSTMGEMATGLAHEVNQPLTAIAIFAQAALRLLQAPGPTDTAELAEALKQITNQALRAGEVIRRIRAFVKNKTASTEPVDVNRLIEDLRVLAEPDARVNDVRLTLDLAPDTAEVAADPVQIQQVLLNLVRNAIDATLESQGAAREITITSRIGAGEAEVAVVDHGAGIDPAIVENLFNPFFTTKEAGTGLGLAISRSIIRAHGGKLGYRSTEGGGTTFYFTLPVTAGG